MAGKSSQPALYEKFRDRGGMMPAPVKADLGPASPPGISSTVRAGTGGGWLSPGRTIRVPVGYVILAAGLAIAILATFYVIGFRAGEKREHAKVATTLNSTL